MSKRRGRRRRWIEFGKDILILLLTGSAVWLLLSSSWTNVSLRSLMGREDEQVSTGQTQSGGWAGAVRPLRMTATLAQGEHWLRYGVQYDQEAVDGLFQQTASLLVEALSNVQQPENVRRWQWNRALQRAPGLCFDFQGELPLQVLLGWLSGEQTGLDATVRRVLLTVEGEHVTLYYYDQKTQSHYRGVCDVITPAQLETAVAALSDNGAFYAFESATYTDLAPDTLLTEDIRAQAVYAAANPVAGGRSDLELLMEDLGFALSACSFYSADEEVARSGSETVRLGSGGTLEYRNGGEDQRFAVSMPEEPELFAVVESCRRLAAQVMGSRCGDAQLYLSGVEETAQGWEVTFDYCLSGSPVWLEEGHAARFVVRGGAVHSFTLCLRQYTRTEQTGIVLPPLQAAAALEALELQGQELLLVYRDGGEERLSAQWAAAKAEEE